MRRVIITVFSGVAEVTECPSDVEVEIIDLDIPTEEELDEMEVESDASKHCDSGYMNDLMYGPPGDY